MFHFGVALLLLSACSGELSQGGLQTEYRAMPLAASDVETVKKIPATVRIRQDVNLYPQV